jgi:hypothetical protein
MVYEQKRHTASPILYKRHKRRRFPASLSAALRSAGHTDRRQFRWTVVSFCLGQIRNTS